MNQYYSISQMLHHHFLEKDNIVTEIHQEGDNHPEHIQEVDSLQYLETLSINYVCRKLSLGVGLRNNFIRAN